MANDETTKHWPRRSVLLMSTVVLAAGAGFAFSRTSAGEARAIPAPEMDTPAGGGAATEVAVLAGGCFWGVQGVFQHVDGVTSAVSGYAGGDMKSARYDQVSRGRTTHAEAVRIAFDPNKISYGRILHVFFSVVHDPTQLDRQGPDIGPHYRSAIFAANAAQNEIAKAYIAQLDKAGTWGGKIVTRLEGDQAFFAAEDYHQDFMTRNPRHPYIVYHDLPKVEALKRLFPQLYRAEPVLVAARK
jgi:peptide-methionine (S)-S-oxide reductase